MSRPEEAAGCCASVLAAPLAEHDAEDLARVFAALGDPVRLRLLSLVADAGEICSCDLVPPPGQRRPPLISSIGRFGTLMLSTRGIPPSGFATHSTAAAANAAAVSQWYSPSVL